MEQGPVLPDPVLPGPVVPGPVVPDLVLPGLVLPGLVAAGPVLPGLAVPVNRRAASHFIYSNSLLGGAESHTSCSPQGQQWPKYELPSL